MNSYRNFILALSLTGLVGLVAPVAHAQSTDVVKLHYDGGRTCNFNTSAATPGVSISYGAAAIINATGSFDYSGSDCPTGGGTGTGLAAVDLSVKQNGLDVTQIDLNESATVEWHATADVCRYDGGYLPDTVGNWQTSGDACVGATACLAGGTVDKSFTIGGNYIFGLTCISGAHDGQQKKTVTKTANLTVDGGSFPPDSCVPPDAGWTRQERGNIAITSGANPKTNVPLMRWDQVLGWALAQGTHWGWPGALNSNTKIAIKANHFVAMKFEVPDDYPFFQAPTYVYGNFGVNDSAPVNLNAWSLSISPICGDFDQPAAPNPNRACYIDFTVLSMPYFSWVVSPNNQPVAGRCNLKRNTEYYLNIAPRTLQSTADTCTPGTCNVNIINRGTMQGTYPQIP